jgi:hypothetical protein
VFSLVKQSNQYSIMLFCKKQKVIDIVLIIAGSYQQRHKNDRHCEGGMTEAICYISYRLLRFTRNDEQIIRAHMSCS